MQTAESDSSHWNPRLRQDPLPKARSDGGNSFAERRHKGGQLSIASAAILARRSCSPYCNFRELGCRRIDTRKSVCSRPISPLFAGKCKQSYGARKAQKGLNECQPRLEIYMAEEENAFQQATPMLFGEEFAKKATDRVEAVAKGFFPRGYQHSLPPPPALRW